jgi:rod shape-determining protein MreB
MTDSDIREALHTSLEQLLEAIREVLETTPPEVVSDVMRRGMVLAGGGALLGRACCLRS